MGNINTGASSSWHYGKGAHVHIRLVFIPILGKSASCGCVVLVATVLVVVFTGDLSKGVFSGIILSAIFFTAKTPKLQL